MKRNFAAALVAIALAAGFSACEKKTEPQAEQSPAVGSEMTPSEKMKEAGHDAADAMKEAGSATKDAMKEAGAAAKDAMTPDAKPAEAPPPAPAK